MDEHAADRAAVAPASGAVAGPTAVHSLVAAVLVVVVGILPAFLTGAVAVQQRADLGFSEAALGLTVAGFFVTGALSSALLGRATERIGATLSLRLAAWSSAVVLLAIAVGAR